MRVAEITPDDSDLRDSERALVERAVAKRRYEVAAGRRLARALLGDDLELGAIDRAPAWPQGVTGSIAHAGGICVVVVSRTSRVLGVDVEPYVPLLESTERLVLDERERAALPGFDRGLVAKRIFCAKEAFFKAQWPLTFARLGFHEASVVLDDDRFVITAGSGAYRGFFLEMDGFLFAGLSITVP